MSMTAKRVTTKTTLEMRDHICPQCAWAWRQGVGTEIRRGMDHHEVIISRKPVMKNPDLLRKVTESVLNGVLLCKACHASPNREVLTDYLIIRHGAEAIIEWIETLGLKEPGEYLEWVRGRAAKPSKEKKN